MKSFLNPGCAAIRYYKEKNIERCHCALPSLTSRWRKVYEQRLFSRGSKRKFQLYDNIFCLVLGILSGASDATKEKFSSLVSAHEALNIKKRSLKCNSIPERRLSFPLFVEKGDKLKSFVYS